MAKKKETAEARLLRLNLVEIAKIYARAEGVSLAVASARVYDNRQLLPALVRGEGTLSIRKYGDVVAKFRVLWPDAKVQWPFLPTLFLGRHAGEK